MLAILLIAALLPAYISAASHPVSACPVGQAPLAIRIPDCPDSPCDVFGGSVSFEADWNAPHDALTLTLDVQATLFGEDIPYPIAPELADVCSGLIAGSCPVTAGDLLTHGGQVDIITGLAGGIPVSLRFTVTNENNEISICTDIHVIVH